MNKQKSETTAQIVDAFMQRTAIGILLVALTYGGGAAKYLVSDDVAYLIGKVSLGLSFLVIALILPATIKYARRRRGNRAGCRGAESYMAEMFKEAGFNSFGFTFILMIGLQVFLEMTASSLPAAFFLNLVLSLSLGVFAIRFFVLTKNDDTEEDEFGGEDAA